MPRSTQVICASALSATVMALVWFKAPLVPALLGALGAALVLYRRAQRKSNERERTS